MSTNISAPAIDMLRLRHLVCDINGPLTDRGEPTCGCVAIGNGRNDAAMPRPLVGCGAQ